MPSPLSFLSQPMLTIFHSGAQRQRKRRRRGRTISTFPATTCLSPSILQQSHRRVLHLNLLSIALLRVTLSLHLHFRYCYCAPLYSISQARKLRRRLDQKESKRSRCPRSCFQPSFVPRIREALETHAKLSRSNPK